MTHMRKIQLIPYNHAQHLESLYEMMMDPDEQMLFMATLRCNSLRSFDGWIEQRMHDTYHDFFMIKYAGDQRVIGFVYATEMRIIDAHCKIATYILPAERRIGIGALATITFLRFLFDTYPLNQVFSEVYDYNADSLQNHIDAHFHEDGVLKEYRFYAGRYHDLHIFSLSRASFDSTLSPLLRQLRE